MRFLDRIVQQKKAEVAAKRRRIPLEAFDLGTRRPPARNFVAALGGGERIIAEVKLKSPRTNGFLQAPQADRLGSIYEAAGAAAVSVVTDAANFGTSLVDAQEIRHTVSLPVLVKDFIIDPYQIYEARAFNADAVLLISRILDRTTLRQFLELVAELGMKALVEVHDEGDLSRTLAAGAPVIGINNRNLDTLTVSLDTTRRLVDRIGDSAVVVSESGIANRSDITELSSLGVDAFLIGGALLQSPDPGALLRELLGDPLRKVE